MMFKHFHFWHIVTISPWPFLLSMFAAPIPLGLVTFFQGYKLSGLTLFYWGLYCVCLILFLWFRDIIRESTFEGYHTQEVQKSIVISFMLFIFSEVMFFVAFFWSFFHSSIFPTVELNISWPPVGMAELIFDPFDLPLLNTLILLLSGATLTLAHWYLKKGLYLETLIWMQFTFILAISFLTFQGIEYVTSPFDISDGIYGSTFFLCTGFHGFHVFLGSIMLAASQLRIFLTHFSRNHHKGFETAAWYWHFVDVVWLFLYIMIYYWGSDMVSPILFIINNNNIEVNFQL